jgi:hypothetical protein
MWTVGQTQSGNSMENTGVRHQKSITQKIGALGIEELLGSSRLKKFRTAVERKQVGAGGIKYSSLVARTVLARNTPAPSRTDDASHPYASMKPNAHIGPAWEKLVASTVCLS